MSPGGTVKLFGEYLVEKSLINTADLAEALIEQVSQAPAQVEVAWKAGLLGAEDLLRLLKLQSQNGIGFREAMTELGLWNSQAEEALREGLRTARVPLGKILVDRGVLKVEALTHALDEYLGSLDKPPAKTDPGADLCREALTAAQVKHYAELAAQLGSAAPDALKELFNEVHRLRGVFRLAGAEESEKLCVSLEECLTPLLELPSCPEDLRSSLARTAQAWCELLAELEAGFVSGEGESRVFGPGACEEKRKSFDGLSTVFKFDLDMASLGAKA